MQDNRIIIIGLLLIIALLAGVLIFSTVMAKEDSNLAIVDKKLNVGDSFVVKLTDTSGNPISNETVHIKLSNNQGTIIDEDITTNSKGKAQFKMDVKGKYSAHCSFDGNGKYDSSSAEANISVKKAATEVISKDQTSTTTHSSKYAPNGGIYPEYGPEVDSQGITRQRAIAENMHYIEMTVDGDKPGEMVTVGGYVAYDPNAGCYHT